MISEPIVFVLGAGSMKDYKFPIGWELARDVVAQFQPDQEMRQLLLNHSDCKADQIEAFVKALYASGQKSVDSFLEEQTDFFNIGVAAMSMVLIRCERQGEIYRERDPAASWLRYLLQHMRGSTFEEFKNNAVSFVTFNYDRSLEFFLCHTLANTFGKSEAEAGAIVREIPIIHVHGRLGYLPWQDASGRPYDTTIDGAVIQNCLKNVKVVNRNTQVDAAAFTEAKRLIAKATRVYFLGVGFNNENMARLGVMELTPNKAISTGVGLRRKEHGDLRARFGACLSIRQDANCIEILRDYVEWK